MNDKIKLLAKYLNCDEGDVVSILVNKAAEVALREAVDDPWREELLPLIDGAHEVTTSSLLTYLGIPPKHQDRRKKARLKDIMTKEGFIARKLSSKLNRDKYGYVRG